VNRLLAWFEERVSTAPVRELIEKKRVPLHRTTIFYYLGGMALFLFIVQVVTGILLLLYYRPTAEAAFESVQFIVTQVHFGWLVRSIHSWSANLMIGVAMLHLVTVFFMRSYRKPREVTWLSGALMFFLLLGFGFSGYLLPWNQLAFFATKVGTDIAGEVPVLGGWLLRFLRGGDQVGGATLTRFFGFHVAVLPMVTTFFLVVHLSLIQVQGMSSPRWMEALPPKERSRRSMPFVPNFLLRDVIGWLFMIVLVAALAAFFPWELGAKADPLKLIPGHILGIPGEQVGIAIFGIGALLLLLLPLLDRGALQKRLAWLLPSAGAIITGYVIGMTIYGYLAKQ
jgi:cytochrome b6